MATAVSIPRRPETLDDMASRRLPLANVPNAVNSPIRSVAAVSGKRTRAQAGDTRDTIYGQPPTKKQAIGYAPDNEENVDPRRRRGVSAAPQDKLEEVFSRRSNNSQPTAFERKLTSARERKPTPQSQSRPADRTQKQQADNLESIRQWQKHYRRQFPQFVFYFDSVSEDVRHKSMRQIRSLGAREEKFFSKAVTHVVTSRSVPSEANSTSPDDDGKYDGKHESAQESTQPAVPNQRRSTTLLDAASRRAQQLHSSIETRRPDDIIAKARALGIKIWALEKLHRVLSTILDTDTGEQPVNTRGTVTSRTSNKTTAQDADLEQLLRHEKIRGPADRDMNVAAQDMVSLRGCYIYIHDMDEKTKPVMVREYKKPEHKEQGKWPQFRLSGPGRCPFIEDPNHAKKAERDAQAAKAQEIAHRKTRAGTSLQNNAVSNQALAEREVNLRRSPRKLAQAGHDTMKQQQPIIQPPPTRRQSSAEVLPAFFNSTAANMRGLPRMVRGEPVASGVQPSNVTSAIRSQIVSSAAISSTAPGLQRRFGDSKEVSLLKRKVLASNHSIPSSYANDVRAAINNDQCPPPRAAKRKAQETLGVVREDDETADQSRMRANGSKRKKLPEKEAKPGYCENCRDKFDDFDDHIASKKHRKFAQAPENWQDLDALLLLLKRPHKKAH